MLVRSETKRFDATLCMLRPNDYSDVGQAKVFFREYGDRIKYNSATKWIVYDGKRWREDQEKARELVHDFTERQIAEAESYLRFAQDELIDANKRNDENAKRAAEELKSDAAKYFSFAIASRKSSRIEATLTEAQPYAKIEVSQLDADAFKLNTPNGTVDLQTGKLLPHNAQDYCTKMTGASPGDDGSEIFNAFLQQVTCGDDDLQRYMQVAAGMFAIGAVYLEKLVISYGAGGNGKSTLFNLISRVLGDYAGNLSAETLTSNCRKNKSPEYAELRGKRLVIAAELEEGVRLDTAVVKKLCSTDLIYAEKKYKDPFAFTPSHTVVLYTNHLPKVGTSDKGTWDRLLVIPFNASFRGEKGEILNYAEYLFKHAGGAVLSWIIEGARQLIKAGFKINEPECVKKANEDYRAANDWLDGFLSENCDIDESYMERSKELYSVYDSYCTEIKEYRRSQADFKAALENAGFEIRRISSGIVIRGLRIKPYNERYMPAGFHPDNRPTPWKNRSAV